MPKVLLTMSCGPYPKLDGISSMDLYSSRLTKGQDIFSFKSYYPRLSIHLIAQNISVPTVVLETPSFRDFVREVKKGYDYIGINFDTIFFNQVLKMCRAIREYAPATKIVLGGYGVVCLNENFQEEKQLREMVDYVCHGEGIRFMRELLSQSTDGPISQDFPLACISVLGEKIYSANLVSALGCRMGCEFCCTSAFFGYQKVRLVGAADLWRLLKKNIQAGKAEFTWIFDEDFFADPDYVREFARYVKNDPDVPPENVRWGGYGSVRSLSQFEPEELVEMGVVSLWIGVESKFSDLPKRQGRDITELFRDLHNAGIQTIGSFIIGWDFHTPENARQDVDFFIGLNPTYTQVSSLMPCPETKFWKRMVQENRLHTTNFKWRKHHLYSSIHKHKNLDDAEAPELVAWATRRLYEKNGSSVLRTFEVNFRGYLTCKNHANPRLRRRCVVYEKWCHKIVPALLAMKIYAPSRQVRTRIRELYRQYRVEFGGISPANRVRALFYVVVVTALKIGRYLPKFVPQPTTRRFYYNHN